MSKIITEILKDQTWAYTNRLNNVHPLDTDRGFFSADVGAIDAPDHLPSGATVENVIKGMCADNINGRWIIGGLVLRG